jgi:3'-5' exoribonuclease
MNIQGEASMNRKYIQDLQDGDQVSGYFLVFEKYLRKTKNNDDYLDLTLSDKTGKIDAKIWDNVAALKDDFIVGDPVAIKGQVVTFGQGLQLKVEHIRMVDAELDSQYGFDISDLLPSTDKDIDQMWQEIQQLVQSIQNVFLKQLVVSIYSEHEENFKTFPASMILHHAFRGGLLEHTLTMAKIADKICPEYEFVDRDLVLTGVLLHDIGKLQELNWQMTTSYSDKGHFIGHLVLGRDMIIAAIKRIPDFPELLRLKIEHIILAHQGKLEWQSPREPLFIEALLVFFIDEMDTRIAQMKQEINSDNTEGIWTSKNNYFHRALFKGSENN